jgi:hypothetical protein
VTHPVADAGAWAHDGGDAPFVLAGSYFGARAFEQREHRGGLSMTFDGTAYPLEDYAVALEDAGLVIEALREPRPAADAQALARWRRIPMFLMLRARRPAA